jgi:hypothetical protein
MHNLNISPGLKLPADAVTQTFGILAKRGAGKTYTGAVLAEEMLSAGLQVVICDPIGVWWGLRASADGKSEGYPIIVFGGEHGDLPLTDKSGALIAETIVSERLSAVIDLGLLRKGEQTRFMTDFCECLYHKNRQALHLILDEADAFAPQRPMPGEQRLLGAIEDIVRRGRARGLGVTMISQRSAVLNKNILTQIEVLVAMRTVAPQDLAAINAWIERHGDSSKQKLLQETLPSLPIGTAWFWSPGWLDLFLKVQIRKRKTFDSSSTPKAGATRIEPRKLAPVDLEKLRSKLATSDISKSSEVILAESAQVAKLTVQLKVAENKIQALSAEKEQAFEAGVRLVLDGILEKVEKLKLTAEMMRPPKQVTTPSPQSAPVRSISGSSSVALTNMQKAILTALAQHPNGLSKGQILLFTGYASSGPVSKCFADLAKNGWVQGNGKGLLINASGLSALGSYEVLPTGKALRDLLVNGDRLGRMERELLRACFEAYPNSIGKGEILRKTGYASSGPVSKSFARLVKYGYVDNAGRGELRANGDLFTDRDGA